MPTRVVGRQVCGLGGGRLAHHFRERGGASAELMQARRHVEVPNAGARGIGGGLAVRRINYNSGYESVGTLHMLLRGSCARAVKGAD